MRGADLFNDGDVVEYPYLWKWQKELGREEGEKDRPVCLAMMIKDARGFTHLIILPISRTAPKRDDVAIEIPPLELKRAGLDTLSRGWITVSEYNYDILERSWDFPVNRPALGRFSGPFLKTIERAFLPTLRGQRARVNRR